MSKLQKNIVNKQSQYYYGLNMINTAFYSLEPDLLFSMTIIQNA